MQLVRGAGGPAGAPGQGARRWSGSAHRACWGAARRWQAWGTVSETEERRRTGGAVACRGLQQALLPALEAAGSRRSCPAVRGPAPRVIRAPTILRTASAGRPRPVTVGRRRSVGGRPRRGRRARAGRGDAPRGANPGAAPPPGGRRGACAAARRGRAGGIAAPMRARPRACARPHPGPGPCPGRACPAGPSRAAGPLRGPGARAESARLPSPPRRVS
jgi:hypothetical protein